MNGLEQDQVLMIQVLLQLPLLKQTLVQVVVVVVKVLVTLHLKEEMVVLVS
jgi:hypothetical protein